MLATIEWKRKFNFSRDIYLDNVVYGLTHGVARTGLSFCSLSTTNFSVPLFSILLPFCKSIQHGVENFGFLSPDFVSNFFYVDPFHVLNWVENKVKDKRNFHQIVVCIYNVIFYLSRFFLFIGLLYLKLWISVHKYEAVTHLTFFNYLATYFS